MLPGRLAITTGSRGTSAIHSEDVEDSVQIVPYEKAKHRDEVVGLWAQVFDYTASHNDPELALSKKEQVADGLLFVAESKKSGVIGTVMGGYDGHRGWIYSLAVLPNHRRAGIGSALVQHAEEALKRAGCLKINLQILEGNESVQRFYEALGFAVEKRISMGKRIG